MLWHIITLALALFFSDIISADIQKFSSTCDGSQEGCSIYHESIPKEFVKIGNKYYLVEDIDSVNWMEALLLCRSRGASLADFETEIEFNDFKAYLDKRDKKQLLWIGLQMVTAQTMNVSNEDPSEKLVYSTNSGKKAKFVKWAPGEPNNNSPPEDCLNIHKENLMNDDKCSFNRGYICQIVPPKNVDLTVTVW